MLRPKTHDSYVVYDHVVRFMPGVASEQARLRCKRVMVLLCVCRGVVMKAGAGGRGACAKVSVQMMQYLAARDNHSPGTRPRAASALFSYFRRVKGVRIYAHSLHSPKICVRCVRGLRPPCQQNPCIRHEPD